VKILKDMSLKHSQYKMEILRISDDIDCLNVSSFRLENLVTEHQRRIYFSTLMTTGPPEILRRGVASSTQGGEFVQLPGDPRRISQAQRGILDARSLGRGNLLNRCEWCLCYCLAGEMEQGQGHGGKDSGQSQGVQRLVDLQGLGKAMRVSFVRHTDVPGNRTLSTVKGFHLTIDGWHKNQNNI
jgi:hypothetical protein